MATAAMLTAEDDARVRRALALIEEAQNLVEEASQELCPVRYFADMWSLTGKLYRRIKRHWHLVEKLRAARNPAPVRQPLTRIPADALNSSIIED
jgi:hypothetical protein